MPPDQFEYGATQHTHTHHTGVPKKPVPPTPDPAWELVAVVPQETYVDSSGDAIEKSFATRIAHGVIFYWKKRISQ